MNILKLIIFVRIDFYFCFQISSCLSASIGEIKMASKETIVEGAEASVGAMDEAKEEVENSGKLKMVSKIV